MKALLFVSLTCSPCGPWFDRITAAGIRIDKKLDMCCRADCQVAQRFSVRSTPTLIYTTDDEQHVVKTFVGTVDPRQITRWLANHKEI
jgi:hypothetical protein